jgi:hypothetical protein
VTNDRSLGDVQVSNLPDAERDASEVVQLLAGLAALLRQRDAATDEEARLLLSLAREGGVTATRVLAYLRDLQGNGDGDSAAVPIRLGQWRDWAPSRGHLLGEPVAPRVVAPRVQGLPQRRRRHDPGE